MTPFQDHKIGAGNMLNPRSILLMRVERAEVPWRDLRFKSKLQSHQSFDKWVTKVMSTSETSKMLMKVGIKKASTLACTISINRGHGDLQFINS